MMQDFLNSSILKAVGSHFKVVKDDLTSENLLQVVKDKNILEDDEATYAKVLNSDFHDGVIEVDVLSRLLPDAPEHARGFIGLAFRISEDDSSFESFYIRPTNGRADTQLRRNRATQYFSYPNFKYFHSREANPGEYESYADIALDEWIHLKVVVAGEKAQLYLNHQEQPVLIVNDLKHGDSKGQIGMWVDIGTEGYFKNLEITATD
ncbi:hypothetical protein [Streptococcus equinus]|uniref:hypothetical protein n=1 Tax=Streptococcus equinus TaxID=1335 RepID=UPI001F3F1744|nr:hypothetical protein [Streptococcus equinus]